MEKEESPLARLLIPIAEKYPQDLKSGAVFFEAIPTSDAQIMEYLDFCKFMEVKRIVLDQPVAQKLGYTMDRERWDDLQFCLMWPLFGPMEDLESKWREWYNLSKLHKFSAKITVALDLRELPLKSMKGQSLEMVSELKTILNKWTCEQISCFIVDDFTIPNIKRFDKLRTFINRVLLGPKICALNLDHIKSVNLNQDRNNNSKEWLGFGVHFLDSQDLIMENIKDAVKHSYMDSYVRWSYECEKAVRGLDAPLKPVTDVLSSETYENFELDTYKYQRYGEAIFVAIINLAEEKRKSGVEKRINVAVLGASRGALVDLVYRAGAKLANEFKTCITAVEFNQFTMFALKLRNREKWNRSINLKCMDLRQYNPLVEDKPDLIVSEFLGSFADNELAPEVFSSLATIMKPNTKIIPVDYTSYIQPCYVPKFSMRLNILLKKKPNVTKSAMYDQPYIMNIAGVAFLAKPMPVFKFKDPCPDSHMSRSVKLDFVIENCGEVTGFLGYFHSILTQDKIHCIDISTIPSNHTPGLESWAPMFFPIEKPMFAEKGDVIVLEWERIHDSIGKKVWYKWRVNQGIWHNSLGKEFHLLLF